MKLNKHYRKTSRMLAKLKPAKSNTGLIMIFLFLNLFFGGCFANPSVYPIYTELKELTTKINNLDKEVERLRLELQRSE